MFLYYFGVACVLLYGVSGGLALFGLFRNSQRAGSSAKAVYFAAVALHSALIGMESVSTGGTLLSGPNIIMLASWVIALITAAGLLATKRGLAFSAAAAPAVAVLMVISQGLKIASPGTVDNMAYYNWPLLVPHIVLVFVAAACFATSATAAILDLYQRKLATAKSAKLLSLDAPALDASGHISCLAGLVGLLVLVGGMLIGFTHLLSLQAAMAAAGCHGDLLYLVPRVAVSLLTVIIWSVFCVLSFIVPWAVPARWRDALAIVGFGAVVVLIAVSAG